MLSAVKARPALPGAGLIGLLYQAPGRTLMVFLCAIMGVRLGLALTYQGYLGVDGGAYILGAQQLLSQGVDDVHFARPPLAPGWLLVPLTELIGGTTGYNVYAAIFSMSMFPGVYLLARSLVGPRWGALATGALALDWRMWELFVTGVVPVTAFGFLALALWGLIGISRGRMYNKLYILAIVAGLPLVAFTNQTTLGLAVVTLGVAWLTLPNKLGTARVLMLAGAVTLVALPWYIDVLPGTARVHYPGPLVYLHPAWSAQWHQSAVGLGIAAILWRTTRAAPLRALAAVVAAHSALNVFLSFDEAVLNVMFRSGHWMQIPGWIALAAVLRQAAPRAPHDLPRYLLPIGIAAFLALGAYGAQDQFYGQAYYSDMAGPKVLRALEVLDLEDVGRIGTNAESRALYIAAVTGKPVSWLQSALPSEHYRAQEEATRCEIGWLEGCRTGYITHFLVDEWNRQQNANLARYPVDWEDPWDFSSVLHMNALYREGSVVLYEVQAP